MKIIKFMKNHLYIDNADICLEYTIKDAFLSLDNHIIVLFDPDSNLGKEIQFKNLICINTEGEKMWTAELPTGNNADVYYKISKKKPLIAYSFSSYECIINIDDGLIVSKTFYK